MKNILLEKLDRNVLIFDGAMGTEIYKKNYFVNTCFEELNLSAPKIVSEIHAEYAKAGADVLTTNTFGANRNKLSKSGFGAKVNEINIAGVRLAREQCKDGMMVAGSVGPIGDIPYNSGISDSNIIEMLAEQISAISSAGSDFIILETISSLKDLEYALKAACSFNELPYVVSLTVSREGESSKGESLEKLLAPINRAHLKPAAIGINCGVGPEGLLAVIEKLIRICNYPIIAQPNAGVPRNIDNRTFYMTSPEYFTTYAVRYVNLGVRGVGGCCGTTPEHIKDLSRTVRPLTKKNYEHTTSITVSEHITQQPISLPEKSVFGRKLSDGKWIKTVEIVPPKGYQVDDIIIKAIKCRDAGIDAINIPDGPRASSRMSPIITALMIQQKASIETILHFCCRDRNLIGMQSDLLGCAAVGIKNLLFITGDPPKLGNYPYASGVFDADSIGMARIQGNLNKGIDIGGYTIGRKTEAVIGVGADPNAIDMDREIRRTFEKIDAGAEFIITQPVFDPESLFRFIEKIGSRDIPLIAGIWPLTSYRNAEFMKNEVPGVTVPDLVMKRMARADTKEAQLEEGINIARESIEKIRKAVKGVQVSAPFGNVDTSIRVLL